MSQRPFLMLTVETHEEMNNLSWQPRIIAVIEEDLHTGRHDEELLNIPAVSHHILIIYHLSKGPHTWANVAVLH